MIKFFPAVLMAGILFVGAAGAQPRAEIKKATISQADVDSLKGILAGVSQDMYNIDYAKSGKSVQRLGSASFRQISTVKGYSAIGSKGGQAANEILTTVDNYVKTIWTSKFAQMYPEKVKAINKILEKNASMQ